MEEPETQPEIRRREARDAQLNRAIGLALALRRRGARSPEFEAASLSPRKQLIDEQREQWRAEAQPAERYGYLFLDDVAEVEEAASVDTRWQVIQALSEQAERIGSPRWRSLYDDLPRVVVGEWARSQVESNTERAKAAGCETALTAEQWENLVADYEARCVYCGRRRPIVLEHAIPLSRGGGTVLDNVVPSCRSCNTSRSDSDPVEWLAANPDRLFCLLDAICKAEGLLVA